MRNGTLIRWAGCCLIGILLLSCSPKKRIVSSGNTETEVSGARKAAVLQRVAQQQLHYTTFSGRAKSNLIINDKERYDVTANVRIVHNEAIWISVTALMGIEVARVFITPDSIKIVNRLRSEYVEKPFAYLRDFAGDALDFSSLEQLLVGNLVNQMSGGDLEVWRGVGGYLLQTHADDLQYAVRVDTNYRNSRTSITAPAYGQLLEVFYSDYQTTVGNSFPNHVEISIVTPRVTLKSDMRYSKVAYNEKIELPFTAPR